MWYGGGAGRGRGGRRWQRRARGGRGEGRPSVCVREVVMVHRKRKSQAEVYSTGRGTAQFQGGEIVKTALGTPHDIVQTARQSHSHCYSIGVIGTIDRIHSFIPYNPNMAARHVWL
jgi:hypothetical protein